MAHTIPVLEKALKLLQALVEDGQAATSSELAKRLEIAPSTCYRILQTLVAHDWLRALPAGRFAFSVGMLPLLRPLLDYQRVFEYLKQPMERLVEDTGLTAKISVKQGDRAVTVYRVESPRGLSPSSKVGASFPLAYGSSGACLLADLSDEEISELLRQSPKESWRLQTMKDVWDRIHEVRKTGVCYDPGKFQSPVHGVSAPVHGNDGRIFVAVTLIGWADDFAGKKLREMQQRVRAVAVECSRLFAEKEAA